MFADEVMAQGEHVMTVCNACRYCEGYCPVFPAMERRLTFVNADLTYLANLCHNCGECLYACQYAPPHEFGINVPATLAKIRLRSYEEYCWPRPLAAIFRAYSVLMSVVATLSFTALLSAGVLLAGQDRFWTPVAGDFYRVMPHAAMVSLFGAVSLFVAMALAMGAVRFWQDVATKASDQWHLAAVWTAVRDALTLRHLHGDGIDCTQGEESRSPWRRWFHHCTAGGFMLCFASTSVAAVYHIGFGWTAPYAYSSVPVILGTLGGLGLIVGPAGLYVKRAKRDPALTDAAQHGLDVSFMLMLFLTSLTGLILLVARSRPGMGILLLVHLGSVLTLFVMLPYGKFVHGIYRTAALIKYSLETARSEHEVDLAPGIVPTTPHSRGPFLEPDALIRRPSTNVASPLDG